MGEVFSSPKSEAAKRLVYPEGYKDTLNAFEGGKVVRVVFNGAFAAKTPLIAQMAMERNISVSILSASTRNIGGKVFGNMLLGIPGDGNRIDDAIDYLKSIPDIFAEEVKIND